MNAAAKNLDLPPVALNLPYEHVVIASALNRRAELVVLVGQLRTDEGKAPYVSEYATYIVNSNGDCFHDTFFERTEIMKAALNFLRHVDHRTLTYGLFDVLAEKWLCDNGKTFTKNYDESLGITSYELAQAHFREHENNHASLRIMIAVEHQE